MRSNRVSRFNLSLLADWYLIRTSGLFSRQHYLEHNPDVAGTPTGPLLHFLVHGAREGRNPGPLFDTKWYGEQYPDTVAAGCNPLAHYVRHGEAEGRAPNRAVHATFGAVVPEDPVVFTPTDSPLVSIIVPVHNQWQATLWCLRSVCANSGDIPFEVIVADDSSTDETLKLDRRVRNVIVAARTESPPLGFLATCNRAAPRARGKYIMFLNNDTLVQRGWLSSLVDVAEKDEKVGIVGPTLIFPDGRLQEAGGIVWNDGVAWNYGRGDDATRPEYNYLRDVDYVSGAALMVRRSLWEEAGGFDERYQPAYYEDVDLAFETRRRGYRVIHQPKSVVIHFEGVSHGTDETRGGKRHQFINQPKFRDKWQECLDREQLPHGKNPFLASNRGMGCRRVMMLDWEIPRPDRDSGSVRAAGLIKVLQAMGCRISFYAANRGACEPYMGMLQQQGIYVHCGPAATPLEEFLCDHGRDYDIVVLSRAPVAALHMDAVREFCPCAFVVFDTVDLHYLREERRARLEGNPSLSAAAADTRRQELRSVKEADLTLVVSSVEKDLLSRDAPDSRIRVVSNIHEIHAPTRPPADRKDLLFIGSFTHSPNVDAVVWFASEVLPMVRHRLPGVCLNIIGADPPDGVRALASAHTIVHGQVKDVAPFFDRCRLSVAPLRYGAGVKGKINQSMSYGLPVVSTTIGCEGMFLRNGEDVMIADGAEAFADAVCRVYAEDALWDRISRNGMENVRKYFSFEVAEAAVREILAEAENAAAARRRPQDRGHVTSAIHRTPSATEGIVGTGASVAGAK